MLCMIVSCLIILLAEFSPHIENDVIAFLEFVLPYGQICCKL